MKRKYFSSLLVAAFCSVCIGSTLQILAQQYSFPSSYPTSNYVPRSSAFPTYPYSSYPYTTYPYSSTRYPLGSTLTSDEGVYYNTPQSSAELGLRYLKLGNTYRESRNVDLAQYYLRRGLELVRGLNSRYWEGVANEYLGLTYRDMGDRITALEYLRRAETIYRSVMNPLRTQSSLDAVQKIVSDVDYGWRYFGRPVQYDASNTYTPSAYFGNTYPTRAIVNSYAPEAIEYERLQRANLVLISQLQDLENRLRLLEQPMTYPGR